MQNICSCQVLSSCIIISTCLLINCGICFVIVVSHNHPHLHMSKNVIICGSNRLTINTQNFKILLRDAGICGNRTPRQNLKSFSKDIFILHVYGNGGNAMENELLKKLSMDLCADKHNYMKSFRKNVDM